MGYTPRIIVSWTDLNNKDAEDGCMFKHYSSNSSDETMLDKELRMVLRL